MSEKEEENEETPPSENPHPTIIETEDKEIPEQMPPNDKIIFFNIVENKEENNSEKEKN